MHPPVTHSKGLAVQGHPVKDAERLREAALGKVRMPNLFFVAFESLSLKF